MHTKPEKNSGLKGILTHDLCDNGAVLYQMNYHATGSRLHCVLVIYPKKVMNSNEYMKYHIFEQWRKPGMKTFIITVVLLILPLSPPPSLF